MQTFPLYIDAIHAPIKITRMSKLMSSLPTTELCLQETTNHTRSFCVASIAEKYLPSIHLSDTFEFTTTQRKHKSRRGQSSHLSHRRQQSKKQDTLSNILFTSLDCGKKSPEAKPIILSSKEPHHKFKNFKLDIRQRISFSPSSPSRHRATKHRVIQPFTPHDPEMSMTIRPASFTQVIVKERLRVGTSSPSYRKTVEVKVPSAQD
mmetsp:Transcript_8146/g.16043  ORF Transcript_8146/g.16043 Transcript_8146/m.16043 type:complete len:206 (-) Transcript_8146:1746-2363(-)